MESPTPNNSGISDPIIIQETARVLCAAAALLLATSRRSDKLLGQRLVVRAADLLADGVPRNPFTEVDA